MLKDFSWTQHNVRQASESKSGPGLTRFSHWCKITHKPWHRKASTQCSLHLSRSNFSQPKSHICNFSLSQGLWVMTCHQPLRQRGQSMKQTTGVTNSYQSSTREPSNLGCILTVAPGRVPGRSGRWLPGGPPWSAPPGPWGCPGAAAGFSHGSSAGGSDLRVRRGMIG